MEYVDLPEIQFVPEDTAGIQQNIITVYEGLTSRTLQPADPVRLFLSSLAAVIVQQRTMINRTAKGNLLRYASGVVLDHMAAFQGAERLDAAPAITSVKFTLSMPLPSATLIPAGTRVGAQGGDGSIYFSTTQVLEIPAGAVVGSVLAACSTPGPTGNGFLPGQVNVLMDPLPFVISAINQTESGGGAAAETDDAFKERIRTAPESYSTAGPRGAYEFWAKSASSAILDVHAYSPTEGEVTVLPLLTGGKIPGADTIEAVAAVFESRGVRPLTDKVTVKPPQAVSYNTGLTYYISRSRAIEAPAIQAAVAASVSAYQLWQRSRLGRDINPSELISRVMAAGALRLSVTAPTYTPIEATQVAHEGSTTITYGGLVDD